ncbi:MAG: HRDC domain-containing protein [Verrucomicrobia bacterium]|nr:HRDC domain-containing protein [Verrucomicrobiota bacterium]
MSLITTATALSHLAGRLTHAAWVAIDTEADSRHCYYEKLCLLQVSHPQGDELVDTLAGLDLQPVFAALKDKEIILQGADYDLRMLRRAVKFVPAAIFDTDMAARLVGIQQTGLGALVEKYFGVKMEKASQKADWAMRPLPEKMIRYAITDTHHLKPLADILRAELERLGRLEWLRQCCDDLIRRSAVDRKRDPDREWRVKGWATLGRAGLAVLRELWHWREEEAQAVDHPPFHVIHNERLVAIADAASHHKDFDRFIPPRMKPERRRRLLEAVHRGQQAGPLPRPTGSQRAWTRPSREVLQRLKHLEAARDARAHELGLAPSLIATRAALEALAQDTAANIGVLLPWQRELLKL